MTAYTHPVLGKEKLTSTFGMRQRPIPGEHKLYGGTDLAHTLGVALYAPAAAAVTRAEFEEGFGNLVELTAGATSLHCGRLETISVAVGDAVPAGAVIGTLGEPGQATRAHLHLEVWRAGERVDPQAEDGFVLARELKISATAAPLAPISAPLRAAPLPVAIPVLAPRGSASSLLLRPYGVTASRPPAKDCPDKARLAPGTLETVT
ncbi:MAG: M23 family metallopeptidase [Hyphomonas sp.]|uniref:M23 family metallopeptidase n=1 Tax=Hyphomonas sp. TaxID=87 RepID=UPI0034A07599